MNVGGGDVGPDARPGLPIAIISASRADGGRLDLPILGAMASASVLSVCPGMALLSLHATYTVMAYTSIAWMKEEVQSRKHSAGKGREA